MLPIRSVLRVLHSEGSEVVGTAFATSRGFLTCAHVVAAAGGAMATQMSLSTGPTGMTIETSVVRAGPPGSVRDDWALLESRGDMHAPLPISSNVTLDHPFSTFGFPTKWEEMGNHATGRIGPLNGAGVHALLGDPEGFRIRPGFSGAPVYDEIEGAVVGIVVGSDAELQQRVAFMIPAGEFMSADAPQGGPAPVQFTEHDVARLAALAARGGMNVQIERHVLNSLLPRIREDPVSRYWAFAALAEVGGRASVAALRQAAERDNHAYARRGAREALERIDI